MKSQKNEPGITAFTPHTLRSTVEEGQSSGRYLFLDQSTIEVETEGNKETFSVVLKSRLLNWMCPLFLFQF